MELIMDWRKEIDAMASRCATLDKGENWYGQFLDEVKNLVKTKTSGMTPKRKSTIHGETWWSLELKDGDEIVDAVALGKRIAETPEISWERAKEIADEGVYLYTLDSSKTGELRKVVSNYIDLDGGDSSGHEIGSWYALDPRSDSGNDIWDKRSRELFEKRSCYVNN